MAVIHPSSPVWRSNKSTAGAARPRSSAFQTAAEVTLTTAGFHVDDRPYGSAQGKSVSGRSVTPVTSSKSPHLSFAQRFRQVSRQLAVGRGTGVEERL